jgi:signal transduction histidine kinase
MTNKPIDLSTNSIKVKLLNYLAQELLTPLTSVVGMASVLKQEIYGP